MREIRRQAFGPVIAAFVNDAQADPEFADAYRTHFVEPRRAAMRAVFARAAERGEVPADLDVEVALDPIYGAVYHRLLARPCGADRPERRMSVSCSSSGVSLGGSYGTWRCVGARRGDGLVSRPAEHPGRTYRLYIKLVGIRGPP